MREVVGVPRGERALESDDGVVVEFARDLRLLRAKAGLPAYRALSERVHYSAAALSEAASGRKLPSLGVTLAYVGGCGGDTAEWEIRWRTTAAELAAATTEVVNGDDRAPYMGLAAFQPEDADWFFGRTTLVAELITRLRERRFLGVFGSSGCGKSSLLRAGLSARLSVEQGSAAVLVFTPGHHPLEECAVHLARFLEQAPGTLLAEFWANSRNLHLRVRQAVADRAVESDVVLVVDQFEELFTLCRDEREQARFVEALVVAATDPDSRTRVVLGVRADFLGHCGRHPLLVNALRDAQVLVGAMTTDELRSAIVGPAERAGYRVETALVARLIADAGRQAGMLPLVSHALLQTWRRRHGAVMTVAAYDSVGGIEHALAHTAEDVYQALDADQKALAQRMFLRLIALGEGTEDTKRRVTLDELSHDNPNSALVLETLTLARLITLDDDSVEIAHEALIRYWPRLRDWLADDREGHRIHRQLVEATGEWERHGRDEGLLYGGARLAVWQDRALDRLNDTERAFLTTSRDLAQRQYRSRRRRVRMTIGGLAAATAIITVLAVVALTLAARAENERQLAVTRQLVADVRAQLGLDPELGLLLAREAHSRTPNADTEVALRQAFVESHVRATFSHHQSAVAGAAFSKDGRQLAIIGRQLRVWDWDNGTIAGSEPRVLPGLFGGLPVFGPGGRLITISAQNLPDRLADSVPTPQSQLGTFSVALSLDGQYMASARHDGDIDVSSPRSGGRPTVLRGHDGFVFGVSFSSDMRRLVSGGADGTVRVWGISSGRSVSVLRGHVGAVNAVAFSADGRYVASAGDDGTIRLWDTTEAAAPVVLGRHAGAATSVTFSDDGRSIASASTDHTVRVWNAEQPANSLVLRGHRDTVTAVAFSLDGKFVVSASDDGTAKIWEVNKVEDLAVFRSGHGPIRSVATSADGRYVVSGGHDGTVRLLDTARIHQDPLVLYRHARPITQVTISSDGRRIASVDTEGVALVGTTTDTVDPVRLPSTDWQRAASQSGVAGVALSPGGKRLAVPTNEFRLHLWNLPATGTPGVLSSGGRTLTGVAWHPDGHHIAGTANGAVLLWDVRTDTSPTVLPGHPGFDHSLAFSHDGKHLASGGNDGIIHLWNLSDRGRLVVLSGHQSGVQSIAFSRDGRNLVSSSEDAIRIWKTNSAGLPLVIKGMVSTRDIAPLPGNRYVTAHEDGSLRIWRCHACAPIAHVLREVDDHVTRQLTEQERRTYFLADP